MIDVASLIPSIIGLGTKIGTAIPGLKKPKKEKVPQLATKFGAQIVGASQSGLGASRGLALRSGLRAAAQGVGEAAEKQLVAEAGAEQRYQAAKDARNARLGAFGEDLAKGLGDMAAIAVGSKDKGTGTDDQPGARPENEVLGRFGSGEVLPGQGVSETPLPEDDSVGLKGLEAEQQQQEQVDQQAFMDDAAQRLQDFQLKREEAGIPAPEEAFQPDPTSKLIEEAYKQRPELAPAVEKELAQNLHMKKLMLAEAERQGISLAEAIPRVNRMLGLSPGQSLMNPMGLDLDVTGEA